MLRLRQLHHLTNFKTSSMSQYSAELKVAKDAVRRASALAASIASTIATDTSGQVTKSDTSPVTVADYGAQAIIIGAIKKAFPSDPVVGEEDADVLRKDEGLRTKVWDLVKGHRSSSADALDDTNAMLDAIDWGKYEGGNTGRMWALDPIDGTKGFLRGGQYAVCLALIVDGHVKVGVIGCPNLSTIPTQVATQEKKDLGVLASAIKDQGAFIEPLSGESDPSPIHFRHLDNTAEATFCESVEAGHSSHSDQAQIAQKLGITKEGVRMDSQAKYVAVSRGQADIYLRLPVSATYQEKIWDHASGNILVTEAGGTVTDKDGNALNFGVGRTLKENKGVIVAEKSIFPKVLEAVKQVLG
ncbi:hypothetical protein B0I72DRAFT_141225 [Yarrowia lipolytica]|nr:hypothetical protein B0I72DRAFT_141225 [Yarrowia lipolytica]RDW43145.1 hypothetical protein B0I74DRAFT_142553 [Yarrowia lipolytica]RDW49905.1 hypothetical protein B0I75DRAFT_142380 [Yarrowia lipolytica]